MDEVTYREKYRGYHFRIVLLGGSLGEIHEDSTHRLEWQILLNVVNGIPSIMRGDQAGTKDVRKLARKRIDEMIYDDSDEGHIDRIIDDLKGA